ncbi:LamB/YcsF family protein [Flavobacteriaceae bacterium F89]|uniref:LamB/YcsF family protein n=1 Tax=Cerina litoralis TaxID=2874477 RepID=A0AAE3EVF8_9FLAO|nr:LamB/YcsF family protein [Cerina litoralis]MCG2461787.1 LamB/YcsF family protein [Cerina litoralis]
MEAYQIDINCDVGEGAPHENLLYPHISSCSIACGGHTGTMDSIKTAVALAVEHGVKIGAHPSYPDPRNFGRASVSLSDAAFKESLRSQMERLNDTLCIEGVPMHHIKPHGALYNDLAKDLNFSRLFLDVIREYLSNCFLYAPYGSILNAEAVSQGFRVRSEAFADRNYNKDLSLVSRMYPDALIQEPKAVLAHLVSMVKNHKVRTLRDEAVEIVADTYCIHGDSVNSLQILTYLSTELPKQNIFIRS